MEARCTGCGGRVMPYHQYVVHFKPTATCGSCGQRVRFRGFWVVMTAMVAALLGMLVFLRASHSPALELTVAAGVGLGALLVDLWTYRNVQWDTARERGSEAARMGT